MSCPICGSEEALPLLEILSRRLVRCGGCGLVYGRPLPSEGLFTETVASLYPERKGSR